MPCRLVCLCLFLGTLSLSAQWVDDPTVNNQIAHLSGGNDEPKMACLPDGSCYVGWYHNVAGPINFEIRLQYLNPLGEPQFGADGLLISAHENDTSTTGWDMIADSSGNAVMVFPDLRTGSHNLFAYRISPAGAFLWGADGIGISENPDFNPAPTMTETAFGEFAFVWSRLPASGDGDIRMQRLLSSGEAELPVGGVIVVADPGNTPTFPDVIPAGGNNVIISWVIDFMVRNVRAQKFNANGNPQWGLDPVLIFSPTTVQFGYRPLLQSDSANGLYMGLYGQDGESYALRYDTDGNQVFNTSLGNNPNHLRSDTVATHNPNSDEFFVFWVEKDLSQNDHGLYGQKLSSTGVHLWTAGGEVLLEIQSNQSKSFVRTAIQGDGAEVFWFQAANPVDDLIKGTRVDADGVQVWNGGMPIDVSTAPGNKGRLGLSGDAAGTAYLVWTDGRMGDSGIYAQSVNPDGSLGMEQASPCPGDCGVEDEIVDALDLAVAIEHWLSESPCNLGNSNQIDILDLVALRNLYGPCPAL